MIDLDDLRVSSGRLIRNGAAGVVLGESDPEDIAVVVLSQPAVWHVLTAAALLERIACRHYPIPRVAGSRDLICGSCRTAWGCDEAVLLGLAPEVTRWA